MASLIGFLLAGVMGFLAVDGTLGGLASRRFETASFLVLEVVFGLAFLISSLYLHKCANRISVFVAQGHNVQLESVLEAQRKFWQFTVLFVLLSLILLMAAVGLSIM